MFSVISSGQVAKHNLSTRNLIKQTHNSHSGGGSLKVGGVIAGSNATETSSFLKNSTIQSSLRTKGNLSKSIQNAVSFVQTQQSKMEILKDIYNRMTELAGYASDIICWNGLVYSNRLAPFYFNGAVDERKSDHL